MGSGCPSLGWGGTVPAAITSESGLLVGETRIRKHENMGRGVRHNHWGPMGPRPYTQWSFPGSEVQPCCQELRPHSLKSDCLVSNLGSVITS